MKYPPFFVMIHPGSSHFLPGDRKDLASDGYEKKRTSPSHDCSEVTWHDLKAMTDLDIVIWNPDA